jgi:hypothetical protein
MMNLPFLVTSPYNPSQASLGNERWMVKRRRQLMVERG